MDLLVDLIAKNKVTSCVNQIEGNTYSQEIESTEFQKEHNVKIESYYTFTEERNNLFEEEVLELIAKKYKKSIAQIILRWLVQKRDISISKLVSQNMFMKEFNIFDFELSEEEMGAIEKSNG